MLDSMLLVVTLCLSSSYSWSSSVVSMTFKPLRCCAAINRCSWVKVSIDFRRNSYRSSESSSIRKLCLYSIRVHWRNAYRFPFFGIKLAHWGMVRVPSWRWRKLRIFWIGLTAVMIDSIGIFWSRVLLSSWKHDHIWWWNRILVGRHDVKEFV